MTSSVPESLKTRSYSPDTNNVYLRGVAITDEGFDRILLEPVGDFGNWNYIIRGFKKGN